MSKKTIDVVKEYLRDRVIDDRNEHGGLYDNTKIKHLVEIVHHTDEDLAICMENELVQDIYNIAIEFYDIGFKDGKHLFRELLKD